MTSAQAAYFTDNPSAAVLYFCSDGKPFFREGDAIAHAAGLGDHTVDTVYANEVVGTTVDMVISEHSITADDLTNNPSLDAALNLGDPVNFKARQTVKVIIPA